MPPSVALSLILPAFNEAGRIAGTIEAVQAHLNRSGISYEVLVAADGTDGTRERAAALAARDPRVVVFGDPSRGGKGRGVRMGVARSRGDVVGFMDADHKTPIEEIDRVLPWLERGFDLVIGSRAIDEARILKAPPVHRRVGSRLFAAGMRAIVGLHGIRDTQCGFKFFRGQAARDLFSRQRIDGYMFDVEVLCLAARLGYRIKEVGVAWRDDGDSRLELVAGNSRNLVDLLRIRLALPRAGEPAPTAAERGQPIEKPSRPRERA